MAAKKKSTNTSAARKWTDEEARRALHAARARGDDDAAADALLRMVEHGAAPERVAGYVINIRREDRKKANRRSAIAPTTAYDPELHDRGHEEVEVEAEGVERKRIVDASPDYRAMLTAAATAARYIGYVLSEQTAKLLEDAAVEGAKPLPSILETLEWFARVQRTFSDAPTVPLNATQVALAIRTALRIARPKDADHAKWILSCIHVDHPNARLHDDADVRRVLAKLDRKSTDEEIVNAASILMRQRTTAGAVRQARKRSKKKPAKKK